jgi:hypothetical protein
VSSTGAHVWPLGRLAERSRAETVSPAESITFPELVWAHFLRQREIQESGALSGPSDPEYRKRRELFVREQGEVLQAYWCTTEASAVALTRHTEGRVLGVLWRRRPSIRFHAATDWVTKDTPDIAHTLHTCEMLAIRVSEVLAGTSERIATQWILSVAGYLLGIVDQAAGKPSHRETGVACRRARAELEQVEAYYDRAGEKTARIVYFWGMMVGVAAVGALALGALGVLKLSGDLQLRHHLASGKVGETATQAQFFACYALGAVGALVSVMIRMASGSGKGGGFTIDYEVGRRTIRRLGSFRPFIGAIFALFLYLVLKGNLLQIQPQKVADPIYVYAALAFVAGFSERFAKVVLGSAELVLGGSGSDAQAAAKPQPNGHAPPLHEREATADPAT